MLQWPGDRKQQRKSHSDTPLAAWPAGRVPGTSQTILGFQEDEALLLEEHPLPRIQIKEILIEAQLSCASPVFFLLPSKRSKSKMPQVHKLSGSPVTKARSALGSELAGIIHK